MNIKDAWIAPLAIIAAVVIFLIAAPVAFGSTGPHPVGSHYAISNGDGCTNITSNRYTNQVLEHAANQGSAVEVIDTEYGTFYLPDFDNDPEDLGPGADDALVSFGDCSVPDDGGHENGGFLSYGTADVIPFQTEAEGKTLLAAGYKTPYCSTSDNPYSSDTYAKGTLNLWGVVPPGRHSTGVLTDESGNSSYTGAEAAQIATSRGGYCWLAA